MSGSEKLVFENVPTFPYLVSGRLVYDDADTGKLVYDDLAMVDVIYVTTTGNTKASVGLVLLEGEYECRLWSGSEWRNIAPAGQLGYVQVFHSGGLWFVSLCRISIRTTYSNWFNGTELPSVDTPLVNYANVSMTTIPTAVTFRSGRVAL